MEGRPIGNIIRDLDAPLETIKDLVMTAYQEGFNEGRRIERLLPSWEPVTKTPEEGQRILLCLDNDTIEAYTYRASDKGLWQLMDKHGKAWVPAPKPPKNNINQ